VSFAFSSLPLLFILTLLLLSVVDIAKRELIDDARRTARMNQASGTPDRVKATRKQWASVEKEIIHGEGLSEISTAMKTITTMDKLPLKYQKVLESFRFKYVSSPSTPLTRTN
jgi:hypothetical protein